MRSCAAFFAVERPNCDEIMRCDWFREARQRESQSLLAAQNGEKEVTEEKEIMLTLNRQAPI